MTEKVSEKSSEELEGHLDDNHLHITAPPGLGNRT